MKFPLFVKTGKQKKNKQCYVNKIQLHLVYIDTPNTLSGRSINTFVPSMNELLLNSTHEFTWMKGTRDGKLD
jgi:hypothetical protein